MSSVVNLGRLQKVELRDAWPHEATNFTPWLAEPENLELLGETLGLELAVEAVEAPVDSFSADILAKDIATDRWVLIENQLEQTDHTHLGQILTYAAGLDAETIVWIAKDFRDPHRAAIDYLNRISSSEFNFFGVQVELFRIGDSAFAPSFNIVAKPNGWSKELSAKANDHGALSGLHEEWRRYWTGFLKVAAEKGLKVARKTPPSEGWCRIEQLKGGDPSAAIWAHWSKTKLRVLVWLQGEHRLEQFDALFDDKAGIEKSAGDLLVWDRMESKKSSFIALEVATAQYGDDAQQYEWFAEHARRLSNAIRPYCAP